MTGASRGNDNYGIIIKLEKIFGQAEQKRQRTPIIWLLLLMKSHRPTLYFMA